MAASVRRICGAGLLKSSHGIILQQASNNISTSAQPKSRKTLYTTLGLVAGAAGSLLYMLEKSVHAFDLVAHPVHHQWGHTGLLDSFDAASIRRGYFVYKQVCAACHSMDFVAYRELVGVCFTEDEAKAEAAEIEVTDGPDDLGNMYKRPGKLSDYFPNPYANENAARAANNGAYPPDLSYIVNGRHGGEDYVFALLTGYCDAPAGVVVQEGQYFNPYFPGGAISMAQALFNEVVEYEDGTPNPASQLAKDVATFLTWTSNPEHDIRKKTAIKVFTILTVSTALVWVIYRQKWSMLKSMKVAYVPKNRPQK